ncbi:MAG: tetratricopeptide repeat protein [bacterium]|nr:tetratricopeptide repeat protein [bacterium]
MKRSTTVLALIVVLLSPFLVGFDLFKTIAAEEAMKEGKELYEAGDYEKAEVKFKEAALDLPKLADPFYWIGRTFEARGDTVKAAKYYDAALDRDPSHFDALNAAAGLATSEARWPEAHGYLRRMADLNPTDPVIRANLGYVQLVLKVYDSAETSFREAIRLGGELARAYDGLGLALDARGAPVEAEEAFKNAVENDPARIEAYVHLGLLYEKRGMTDEAAAAYTQALRVKTTGPLAEIAKKRLDALGVIY